MAVRYSAFLLLAAMSALFVTMGCAQHSLRSYVFEGSGRRGWLGVEVEDVTRSLREREALKVDAGAYVRSVVNESPAERAGIQKGDVIVKFDGNAVKNSEDLIDAVGKSSPGSEVRVEVARGSADKELSATIGRSRLENFYSFGFPRRAFPRIPSMPRRPFAFHFFGSDEVGGLVLQSLTKQLGEYFEVPAGRGVLVAEVRKDGEGEKAGFKAGDVITKINGEEVRDVEDVLDGVSKAEDTSSSFEVYRKGKAMTLTMKIDAGEEENSSLERFRRWEDRETSVARPWIREMDFGRLREEVRDFVNKLQRQIGELRKSVEKEILSL